MAIETYQGTLVVEECYNCSCMFGMPQDFYAHCRNTGESFYCPHGHKQYYTTPKITKLRRELERAERQRDLAREATRNEAIRRRGTERQLSATRGVVTRVKNRTAKGMCPCCKRHFVSLRKHMAHKHPDYASEQETER